MAAYARTHGGYEKGSTPAGRMDAMREAFAGLHRPSMHGPDPEEACGKQHDLGNLVRQMQGEAADFRNYLAAYLRDYYGLTTAQIGALLGVSHAAGKPAHRRGTRERQSSDRAEHPA